jgi:ribA/ribD-fused uncharacterized protein
MMGNDEKKYISKNWDEKKDEIMYFANKEKLLQNANAKCILLNTGSRRIIESSAFDNYRGQDKIDGKGLNKLGKILENLREELRKDLD